MNVMDAVRGGLLRPSTIWHHLFSRAPAELPSPPALSEWSARRYIAWLDTGGDQAAEDGGSGTGGDGGGGSLERFCSSDPLDMSGASSAGGDGVGGGQRRAPVTRREGGASLESSSSSSLSSSSSSDSVLRATWQRVLEGERSAWRRVRRCLEAYVQRISVKGGDATVGLHPVYRVLLESGPVLLAAFSAFVQTQ